MGLQIGGIDTIMTKRKSYNYFIYYPECKYFNKPPYDPEEKYPEYPFEFNAGSDKNDIYRMIREIFINSKLDIENYNTPEWNPLGKYIESGNVVLIKPNLVMHYNLNEKEKERELDCLITHPSVVRCLFDYVYIALKGKGKIIIADAPVQDCKFDILLKKSGYEELFKEIKHKVTPDLQIDIADLRETVLDVVDGRQRQMDNENKKYGSKIIDLGGISKFTGGGYSKKVRITNYAAKDTEKHHRNGKNEYCVSDAMLEADVIINIPKPKTHRIAGYTAALKNMIGINARKEYLPHHQKGAKGRTGDEYIGTYRILKWINSSGNDIKNWALSKHINLMVDICNEMCRCIGKKLDKLEDNRKKFGAWHGNDTIWRTIMDVNKIVYFVNKEGALCDEKQRTVLHFGDMVVCGEGEGPLMPSYKKVGGILFSDNPVAFDFCVAKIMGFDYKKLPTLEKALKDQSMIKEEASEINLCSNANDFNRLVNDIEIDFKFEPSVGWRDYL